jgi:hypothetical protein
MEPVPDIVFHHLLGRAADQVRDACAGQRRTEAQRSHDEVDRLTIAGGSIAIGFARAVVGEQNGWSSQPHGNQNNELQHGPRDLEFATAFLHGNSPPETAVGNHK